MNPSHILRTLPLLMLAALSSSACVHHVHRPPTRVVRSAPPPWAPAHGYRHRHRDVTLVFDGNLDCYAISGHSHHFYHRDHYYRFQLGHWERAPRFRGPWRRVSWTVLPSGLQRWRARTPEARIDRRVDRRRDQRERRHDLARERREHQRELARAKAKLERERAQRALRKPRRPERREPAEQRGREEQEAEKGNEARPARRGKKGKGWALTETAW